VAALGQRERLPMVEHIERLFPGLRGTAYQVTSPADEAYNCIAWAAGNTTDCWWPADPDVAQWPNGIPREETLEAFREAFATLGYVVCQGEDLEPGFQKIALFATDQGVPKHAARQLPNGHWSSKLGTLEDIEHALQDLVGTEYGLVVLVMKRPRALEGEKTAGEGMP
jgi:hypothetical protein